MNNFLNYKDYDFSKIYNNLNNNFDSYKKEQLDMKNYKSDFLFNPYQGLIRGNMFEQLYNPYKIKEPYNLRPMNKQAEMLTQIDSLTFACVDLNLYLDVNPDDKGIIELYNQYCLQKKRLINDYENMFGPITLESDSLNTYPWGWNDMPWPWEN